VLYDPTGFTSSLAKNHRKGRIFVDYLRNQLGATAIAPYSARARPDAPVATPLSWREVEQGVRGDQFTVLGMAQRLAAVPEDPWREMTSLRQKLPKGGKVKF
jgi:bifunctional non-homologous end joining protein LigD